MTEEIKEILDDLGNKDNYIEEFGYQYKRINLYDSFQLLDYITNLQQDLDKANDIIEKDRQFNQGRLLDIAKLKEENERLKEELEKADSIAQSCIFEGSRSAGKSYRQCLNWLEDYKSRCEKAIEFNQIVLNSDYIYSQDEIAFKNLNILNGSDEK